MPWARLILVERRHWLTGEEFVDALSMCQFIPGPNIVNFAVALGGRFQGPLGSIAGISGILLAPMVIVIAAYLLLARVADNPTVIGALHGMSAAATGLVVALAVKVATPMVKKRDAWAIAVALLAVLSVALLRVPLIAALVVIAPIAIAGERFRATRGKS